MPENNFFSRRFVTISREGWYFLFILAFIVTGSIMRQVNLLVILAGLMIAAILFNWRIAMTMIRWLSAKRRLPDWAHAGETFIVEWAVKNHRSKVPTWNLNVKDRIEHVFGTGEINRRVETVHAVIPTIESGNTGYGSYRCLLDRRGVYKFGPANLENHFPFGLVLARSIAGEDSEFFVAPKIGKLTPTWQRRMRATAAGTASLQRQKGNLHEEFYGIRKWQSGDSTRWIHWRSTAKRGELAVKQFDQPTDRDLAIALDLCSGDLQNPVSAKTIESAVSAIATLIVELRQVVKGNIAIGIFGDEQHIFCDTMSHQYLTDLMRTLAKIQPAEQTNIEKNLIALKSNVANSTPLIVLSTRPDPNGSRHRFDESENIIEDALLSNVEWIEIGTPAADELFRLPDDPELPSSEQVETVGK